MIQLQKILSIRSDRPPLGLGFKHDDSPPVICEINQKYTYFSLQCAYSVNNPYPEVGAKADPVFGYLDPFGLISTPSHEVTKLKLNKTKLTANPKLPRQLTNIQATKILAHFDRTSEDDHDPRVFEGKEAISITPQKDSSQPPFVSQFFWSGDQISDQKIDNMAYWKKAAMQLSPSANEVVLYTTKEYLAAHGAETAKKLAKIGVRFILFDDVQQIVTADKVDDKASVSWQIFKVDCLYNGMSDVLRMRLPFGGAYVDSDIPPFFEEKSIPGDITSPPRKTGTHFEAEVSLSSPFNSPVKKSGSKTNLYVIPPPVTPVKEMIMHPIHYLLGVYKKTTDESRDFIAGPNYQNAEFLMHPMGSEYSQRLLDISVQNHTTEFRSFTATKRTKISQLPPFIERYFPNLGAAIDRQWIPEKYRHYHEPRVSALRDRLNACIFLGAPKSYGELQAQLKGKKDLHFLNSVPRNYWSDLGWTCLWDTTDNEENLERKIPVKIAKKIITSIQMHMLYEGGMDIDFFYAAYFKSYPGLKAVVIEFLLNYYGYTYENESHCMYDTSRFKTKKDEPRVISESKEYRQQALNIAFLELSKSAHDKSVFSIEDFRRKIIKKGIPVLADDQILLTKATPSGTVDQKGNPQQWVEINEYNVLTLLIQNGANANDLKYLLFESDPDACAAIDGDLLDQRHLVPVDAVQAATKLLLVALADNDKDSTKKYLEILKLLLKNTSIEGIKVFFTTMSESDDITVDHLGTLLDITMVCLYQNDKGLKDGALRQYCVEALIQLLNAVKSEELEAWAAQIELQCQTSHPGTSLIDLLVDKVILAITKEKRQDLLDSIPQSSQLYLRLGQSDLVGQLSEKRKRRNSASDRSGRSTPDHEMQVNEDLSSLDNEAHDVDMRSASGDG